ncbi:MAG: hypothetical protein CSA66_02820 [Proteobacteria bacterium]|nr:MAG: hypothetical protein CSA66_02820 [Pseudomonadota bacterium]
MGRIKGRKPEQTREALLAAATAAFAEHGFANATLGLIARRAGVTAATLPYHFGDKRGLYDTVVDSVYKDLLDFGDTIGTPATFAEIIESVYTWAELRRDAIRVMLRSVLDSGGADNRVRKRKMGPALDLISALLAQRFEVPSEGAREAVIALTHLVMRFVTNTREDNRIAFAAADDDQARDRILGLLVKVGSNLLGVS